MQTHIVYLMTLWNYLYILAVMVVLWLCFKEKSLFSTDKEYARIFKDWGIKWLGFASKSFDVIGLVCQ